MADSENNQILVRRYGDIEEKCVVFFPGQHGGISRYESSIFSKLITSGVTVFALSYPGQEGANGRYKRDAFLHLLEKALATIGVYCEYEETVFVARSLGSSIALAATQFQTPTGIVLEGVAPSLSDALYARFQRTWYLKPLLALPLETLLQTNYSVFEPLTVLHSVSVVIFQGGLDEVTPIKNVKTLVAKLPWIKLIEIDNANHSNTYTKAGQQYVDTIVDMLD
ncbi:alpha/beta hydrolase [Kaarinaea lacus]